MPFTDRFQLLDLKRDEGARTYEAREIATGRPVYVHVFADCYAPLNRALLAKLDTLPEEERHRILDRGELDVGVYVVTDRLAEYPGLREWLKAKHEERPKSLDARGAWQLKPAAPVAPPPLPLDDRSQSPFDTAVQPVVEPSVVAAPPVSTPVVSSSSNSDEPTVEMLAPAAPPAAPGPGEFTRQFASVVPRSVEEIGPSPFDTAPLPTVEPSLASPPPVVALGNSGEQTLQMEKPIEPPAVVRPVVTPPPTAPIQATDGPGEFTRQFARPVLRPAAPSAPKDAAPPAPPVAPANEPGEFTRQFAPPVLRPAAPPEPGEFTRQFASSPPKSAAPAKPAPPPGEFTRQFQAPQRPVPTTSPKVPAPSQGPPQTPSPSGQQPGEFTQMLQAQRPAAPSAKQPSQKQPSQSGEFARYFESPMTPPPQGGPGHAVPLTPVRPPSHPKDAGEFTQVFGRGDIPSPPPPQAPAAPPNSANSNATQVFATPRPNSPMPMVAPNMSPPVGSGGSAPSSHAPGEYTQMFAKPASLTFGQPQAPQAPQTAAIKRNSSRLPLLLLIGAVVLLVIAVIVYFVMRPRTA